MLTFQECYETSGRGDVTRYRYYCRRAGGRRGCWRWHEADLLTIGSLVIVFPPYEVRTSSQTQCWLNIILSVHSSCVLPTLDNIQLSWHLYLDNY